MSSCAVDAPNCLFDSVRYCRAAMENVVSYKALDEARAALTANWDPDVLEDILVAQLDDILGEDKP